MYILELGFNREEIRRLAANGKFNLGIIQAFARDELAIKDGEVKPIINKNFTKLALEGFKLNFR